MKKNKKAWGKLNYWQKGAIIALILTIFLPLIGRILADIFLSMTDSQFRNFILSTHITSIGDYITQIILFPSYLLWSVIFPNSEVAGYFATWTCFFVNTGIGALIGLIIGKIKSKK